jgi:hypothetical protein
MNTTGFLEYGRFRYLRLAAGLGLLAGLATVMLDPGQATGRYWQSYGLGSLAALLVAFLAWYGVRRRRTPYQADRRGRERRRQVQEPKLPLPERRRTDRRTGQPLPLWRHGGTLQGWLSAHVYLGLLLLLLISLHSGLRLGWNIHSLAYGLLALLVATGAFGIFAYLRYPRRISDNMAQTTLDDLLLKICELDELARARALSLPDEVNGIVAAARGLGALDGGLWRQLGGGRVSCPTEEAIERLQSLSGKLVGGEQPRLMRDLYTVLLQKRRLLRQARADLRFNARMRAWLLLHAPLTLAALAALLAHVFTVFIFW